MAPKKKNLETDIVLQSEIDMHEAGKLISSIAIILNNSLKHYWLSQADANAAMAECYNLLSGILKTCDRIALRIINNAIMLNGNHMEDKSDITQMFIDHLSSLKIDNFDIVRGISQEEFMKLLEVIAAQPDEMEQLGGFVTAIAKFEFKNVHAKKMIYHEIAEEEMVVSKKDFEKAGGPGHGGGEGGEGGSILAFLRGEISVKDENAVKNIQETASDPEKMAELILRAAEIRQEAANAEGGESLVDFVVGCLRRAYEGMTQDASFQTQKGRKKTARNLILLEEEILNRMRQMHGKCSESDLSAISEATEEITDEIKIDELADEYMTKIEASRACEQKIVQFIKSKDSGNMEQDKLHGKLAEKGMSPEGWQELVIKSGAASGSGGGLGSSRVFEAITHLDILLDNMEREFEKSEKQVQEDNARKLLNVLKDVNLEVRAVTIGTNLKIQTLIKNIKSDEKVISVTEKDARNTGKNLLLTRQEVLDLIGGIMRDIGEPLELIRSSLDMVTSKVFGKNADMQTSAIDIAVENVKAIKTLIEKLNNISSLP